MKAHQEHLEVIAASDDLRRRTLSQVPRPLDRLIYLASMRDYNTGLYHHDGLAARFSEEVACEALSGCHREAFRELLSAPLEDLVAQLEAYLKSTHTYPADFINAWKGLEPYRVTVPVDADPLAAEFLFSNLRIALAILERRLNVRSTRQPAS